MDKALHSLMTSLYKVVVGDTSAVKTTVLHSRAISKEPKLIAWHLSVSISKHKECFQQDLKSKPGQDPTSQKVCDWWGHSEL